MPRPRATEASPKLCRLPGRRKWYCRWTPPGTGRSRVQSTGCEDRDEAERWLTVFAAGLRRPPAAPTVGDLLDAWQRTRAGNVAAPKQLALHVRLLKAHFGPARPADITGLVASYPHPSGAARRQLQDLRAALAFARRQGWLETVPDIALPAPGPPRDRFLTQAQAQRLIEACTAPHLRLFVLIALSTGARRGAILELTWDRILWDQQVIDFHDPDRPVTRKRRAAVKVQPPLLAALRDARQFATTGHVIEWGGKPVGDIKTAFNAARRAADLEWATPHVLKHTAISWLAELGWTVDQIADFTETHPATVRRIYRKFSPDYLQDVSESLSRKVFMPTPRAKTKIGKSG